jgi:pre-rRNA-processing protein TSR1
MDVVA